jgi:hypothetical protein
VTVIDVERLLKRVVNEVFGTSFDVRYAPGSKSTHDWRASVSPATLSSRAVSIRATDEWFGVHLEPFDVGHVEFEYDDDEGTKEAALRELALVARAFLEGEGRVEKRPARFGRRERATVAVQLDGTKWVLGRRVSSVGPV